MCSKTSTYYLSFIKWLKSKIYEATNINSWSLLNRLICRILLSCWQNHSKFEVTEAKEINKCKMFLHFYAFIHFIRRNQSEFPVVWSELEKSQVENLVKIFYDHERSWMILSRSLSWKDLAKILASWDHWKILLRSYHVR